MDKKETKRISKFLSLVLRHKPETIGIKMDDAGWVELSKLLDALSAHGRSVSREQLLHVVESNDKKRFSLSENGLKIRAKQGHSVTVELGYPPSEPPGILCHGTPTCNIHAIRESGLKKMQRHHVHLNANPTLAKEVGARAGTPVLLQVRALEMHHAGFVFYVTENDVWLTNEVPAKYIDFPSD